MRLLLLLQDGCLSSRHQGHFPVIQKKASKKGSQAFSFCSKAQQGAEKRHWVDTGNSASGLQGRGPTAQPPLPLPPLKPPSHCKRISLFPAPGVRSARQSVAQSGGDDPVSPPRPSGSGLTLAQSAPTCILSLSSLPMAPASRVFPGPPQGPPSDLPAPDQLSAEQPPSSTQGCNRESPGAFRLK
uniref:proline-rich receptor-like protein kinase PERK9 n=1 Tax=Ictidomys tridecemlineatus TaxID=43179 RepID=UPI001A9EF180|nr:proline-rich receptor-like protein kinase PERK9 [Ictidomys tridecemlineatus]